MSKLNDIRCRGCKNYEHSVYLTRCVYSPSIDVYGNKLTCPCLNCIVKMVCSEACDALYSYSRNFTLSSKSLLRE